MIIYKYNSFECMMHIVNTEAPDSQEKDQGRDRYRGRTVKLISRVDPKISYN